MIRALRYLAAGGSLSLACVAIAAPIELFFSEYIEGSSNNKALEIYNGTGAAVDLAAGGYSVQVFFNGSAAAGATINLAGTIASDDVFVIAHSSAVAAILAQADLTTSLASFNGDDAVVLRKGTTVIDSIGQVGFDPGTEWGSGLVSTADNTLRRLASVLGGDSDPFDAFDPALEWTGFAIDTFSGLGVHQVSAVNVPEPGALLLMLLALALLAGARRQDLSIYSFCTSARSQYEASILWPSGSRTKQP